MNYNSLKLSCKLIITTLACTLATACVQMPTEKQSIADMRPQISFKANGSDSRVTTARVILDNMDVGTVQDYLDGIATLKVQPGTHQLRIVQGNQVIHEERFYAGDGVTKSFVLK